MHIRRILPGVLSLLFFSAVTTIAYAQTVGPVRGVGVDEGFFGSNDSSACLLAKNNALPRLQALADAQCAPAAATVDLDSIACQPPGILGSVHTSTFLFFAHKSTCTRTCTIDYSCDARRESRVDNSQSNRES